MKCATIVNNSIVIFARGKPRNILEACCSFLLIFDLKTDDDGLVCGFDPEYRRIKVNPIMYAEHLNIPIINSNISTGDL